MHQPLKKTNLITQPRPALMSDRELNSAIARIKARAFHCHDLARVWEKHTAVPALWKWGVAAS